MTESDLAKMQNNIRVTQADVDANMQDVFVTTIRAFEKPVTYVEKRKKNGFTVRETTTCVDPANYNEEIGKISAIIINLSKNNVYHSDLNIHNLLLDEQGNVWVIAFDKSKIVGNGMVGKMLERLERSLNKERRLASSAKEQFFYVDDVFSSIKEQVLSAL